MESIGDDDPAVEQMMLSIINAKESYTAAMQMCLSSSDEEDDCPQWGGSKPGKSPNKDRDFVGAFNRLMSDYFSGTNSLYDETDFERRFRMSRAIFNRISAAVIGTGSFIVRFDALGKPGIQPLVRLTACIRYLGYGDSTDRQDEYLKVSESVLNETTKEFARTIIREFGPQYMNRCPTVQEKENLMNGLAKRGFPGYFASWDCKHFDWGNCPLRLAGQCKGHSGGGKRTLILEAISDADLYMWYIFFGSPGSLNDINILDRSSIVGAMLAGTLDLKVRPYFLNGRVRDWMYFLVDGIYPKWAIFVSSTITNAMTPKHKHFTSSQEAQCKDVERCFGVLVQRFHILKRPLRGWYREDITELLYCCVIIHNMIVEEKREIDEANLENEIDEWNLPVVSLFGQTAVNVADMAVGVGAAGEAFDFNDEVFADRVAMFSENMLDKEKHFELKEDLIEHLWNHRP